MTDTSELRDFLLAFADDEHLIGQQHAEWIGVAPFLEEDLAFSSIGQDELGHAALLYELVLELDGRESTDVAIDDLAYGRTAHDYRSSSLVEYHTTDWAQALVRHWVYDTAEALRWTNVQASSYEPLAMIVDRAQQEETYHRRHADALLDDLLPNQEAHQRINAALDAVLPYISSVLAPVASEAELVASGVISQTTDTLVVALAQAISSRFDRKVELGTPAGDRSYRSSDFAPLMARMREVIDIDPKAIW